MKSLQNDLACADKEISVRKIQQNKYYSLHFKPNKVLVVIPACMSVHRAWRRRWSFFRGLSAPRRGQTKRWVASSLRGESPSLRLNSPLALTSCDLPMRCPSFQPGPDGAEAAPPPLPFRQHGHWPQHDLWHHHARWCGQETAVPVQEDAAWSSGVSLFNCVDLLWGDCGSFCGNRWIWNEAGMS